MDMAAQLVLGIFLSILEGVTLLIFPLVLFRYDIRGKIPRIFLISLLSSIASIFVREFVEISYSIFIIMLITYVSFMLLYQSHYINALIILAFGYLANTTIMTVILFVLTTVTKKPSVILTSIPWIQVFMVVLTSVLMLACSYIIKKKKWGLDLIQHASSHLGKESNRLVAAYAFVGLIMVVQTITAFSSVDYNFYRTSLVLFSTFGLFLIMFLLLRNIKIMKEQAKIEEEKLYLEEIKSFSEEIKHINADFFSQMQVIQQLAASQDKLTVLRYVNHLLDERKFIRQSIEIYEPMLSAFLQKERNVCESVGIDFIISAKGHYLTPNCISGYKLNRLLKEIMDLAMNAYKDTSNSKVIKLEVISYDNLSFHFEFYTGVFIPFSLIEQIEIHRGTTNYEFDPKGEKTHFSIFFPRS